MRVTASDVRRRLLHHYSADESESEFHISFFLPALMLRGSLVLFGKKSQGAVAIPEKLCARDCAGFVPTVSEAIPAVTFPVKARRDLRWLIPLVCTFILERCDPGRNSERTSIHAQPHSSEIRVLPWSVFFANSTSPTLLVRSDPNIAEIHALTWSIRITVGLCQPEIHSESALFLRVDAICHDILRGDKAQASIRRLWRGLLNWLGRIRAASTCALRGT